MIEPTECPGCRQPVRQVHIRGLPATLQGTPDANGIYQIRGDRAVMLTTVQQFGKQGQLHSRHKCRGKKR